MGLFAGEHTHPTRSTERTGAGSAREVDRAFRQPVQIGSLHDGIPGVAGQVPVMLVGEDEKEVGRGHRVEIRITCERSSLSSGVFFKIQDPAFLRRLLPPYAYCSEQEFPKEWDGLPEGVGK